MSILWKTNLPSRRHASRSLQDGERYARHIPTTHQSFCAVHVICRYLWLPQLQEFHIQIRFIEHSNQLIVGGVTACLIEAGMPPCYWSYVAPCLRQLQYWKSLGKIKTMTVHGRSCGVVPFPKFPFGALVTFKPNSTREQAGRWDPPGQHGIFAGYKMNTGTNGNGVSGMEVARF